MIRITGKNGKPGWALPVRREPLGPGREDVDLGPAMIRRERDFAGSSAAGEETPVNHGGLR
jgi:hypothetical protein